MIRPLWVLHCWTSQQWHPARWSRAFGRWTIKSSSRHPARPSPERPGNRDYKEGEAALPQKEKRL
jgi:hypothetical protein